MNGDNPKLVLASGSDWVIRFPDGGEQVYSVQRELMRNARLRTYGAINKATKQTVIILTRIDEYGCISEIESVTRSNPQKEN